MSVRVVVGRQFHAGGALLLPRAGEGTGREGAQGQAGGPVTAVDVPEAGVVDLDIHGALRRRDGPEASAIPATPRDSVVAPSSTCTCTFCEPWDSAAPD